MAVMMQNDGFIFANEVDKFRCERLKFNAEKQGATIIHTINEDGTNTEKLKKEIAKNYLSENTKLNEKSNTEITNKEERNCIEIKDKTTDEDNSFSENNFKFDKVLVDVPCSGEGRFLVSDRKTYEHWSLNLQKSLIETQKGLLETAIKLCKENGTIVYSTCALGMNENEKIIDWAIKNFNIEVEKINLSFENVTQNDDSTNSEKIEKKDNIELSKSNLIEKNISNKNIANIINSKSQEGDIINGNCKGLDETISNTIKILPSNIFEGFFVAKLRRK